MWAQVVNKDLTDPAVLAKETLRAKWEANPITQIEHTEKFLKYILSVLDNETQQDMRAVDGAFTAASAAEAQEDAAAAFIQIGEVHRDRLIDFMDVNNYKLPSSQYLQQRIERKTGARSWIDKHKTTITQIDHNANDNNANDNNADDNNADDNNAGVYVSNAGRANP